MVKTECITDVQTGNHFIFADPSTLPDLSVTSSSLPTPSVVMWDPNLSAECLECHMSLDPQETKGAMIKEYLGYSISEAEEAAPILKISNKKTQETFLVATWDVFLSVATPEQVDISNEIRRKAHTLSLIVKE